MIARLFMFMVLASQVCAAPNGLARALLALPEATRWTVVQRVPLAFDAHHPQGLVKHGERFYLTSVEKKLFRGRGWIHEFSADGREVRRRQIASGKQYHPGGLDFDGTALWTAVAEYRPRSSARVVRIDLATLEPQTAFTVTDHLGALVRLADCDTFVGASWGAEWLYTLDAKGAVLARRANPSRWIELQDCKYLDGQVMLGAGFDGDRAGVELFRLDTNTLAKRLPIGVKSDRGSPMTRNPLAAELVDGRVRLYCVPDDGRSVLYVLEPR